MSRRGTRRLRRGEKACSSMGRSIALGGDPKGVQGGERKAPCLHHGQQLCRRNSPWWGMTRRLRRGERACSPMGYSIALGGDPKGVQGGERKATLLASIVDNFAVSNSPWRGLTRRLRRGRRACSPMGRSIASNGDPKGCRGRAESPLLASISDNFAARNSPLAGPDAPTPARIGTGRPKGRSHFSFGGERKVCKRKPAARRLQRRPAPLRTAAKPCATLVLGYALHGLRPFLALVGLRPPLVAGFVLR